MQQNFQGLYLYQVFREMVSGQDSQQNLLD